MVYKIAPIQDTRKLIPMSQNEDQPSTKQKAKKYALYAVLVLFALYVVAWLFSGPSYGTIRYGICKVFLQRSIPYPDSLDISAVWEGRKIARIQFSHTDAFGQYRLSRIQCNFDSDQDLANRVFLRDLLEQVTTQGGSLSNIARVGEVPESMLRDYMTEKRAKLTDSGTINRIATKLNLPIPRALFVLKSVVVDGRSYPKDEIISFRKSIPAIVANPPDLAYPGALPSDIKDYKK